MERRNVNLSGYNTATLSFDKIVDTEAGCDEFSVNIRDQYHDWHCIYTESGITDPLQWDDIELHLDNFAGQSGLYIQFRYDSDGSVSGSPYAGVYIDNIELNAEMSCTTDPYEPNNTSAQATSIDLEFSIYAYICPQGDEDWFKVPISGIGTYTIDLTSLPDDYDLKFYDPNLNLLDSSTNGGTNSEQIEYSNFTMSGYYYIRVYGYSGAYHPTDSYHLETQWEGNEPPNPPSFYSNGPSELYSTKSYSVTIDYTDDDGRTDIRHVYLRLAQNDDEENNRITIMWYELSGNPTQWNDEISNVENLSATKTNITNGYRVTWNFTMKWNWIENTNVDYWAWAYDYNDNEGDHTKNNRNADYENDIRIYTSYENQDPITVGDSYTVTGDVRFEGTTTSPDNWGGISVEMHKNSVTGTLLDNDGSVSSGYSVTWNTQSGDEGTYDIYSA